MKCNTEGCNENVIAGTICHKCQAQALTVSIAQTKADSWIDGLFQEHNDRNHESMRKQR